MATGALSQRELDERLAAAVTPYGIGTRSYNRSAEKREMARQRAAVTSRHQKSLREQVLQPLVCTCPQRPYPHTLNVHRKIRYESRYINTNEPILKWPWTLRFLGDAEL